MPHGFPKRLIIGTATGARVYRVAGTEARTPRWVASPVPSQPGETVERLVHLGDGRVGIIGSHRHRGQPTRDGVADVTNGDTSVESIYGAGPGVTTINLATGNTYHAAGSIGGSLSIGGGGAPSIGAGAISATPTAIWADGPDTSGRSVRYIYAIAGGRLKVVDPTTDTVVETTGWTGVDGGSAARWASAVWLARRGGSADYVQYVTNPYSPGGGTSLGTADFSATHVHAGPDALYRAYKNFTGNAALVKKTTSTVAADVDGDANWAPSSGETMGDPSTPITSLATLGERLVIGKESGLGEMDQDFTFRHYLEWMVAFAWEHNALAVLPVGQAGEVIVGYRRGLYYLPNNVSIGTEALSGNESDKKGRYTAITYDGNWLYCFLESPTTDDTHLIKMRPRRSPGPGMFEHHPIATLTDREVLATYIWPGANVSGTAYGPRLYFGYGSDGLAYIRLGETQPDVFDSNDRRTTGAWSIQWPHDDFDNPQTLKMPYKVEGSYKNVTGTSGITWAVSANGGSSFTSLTADGSTGAAAVTADGFAQRFGPRDNSLTGRELIFRVSGTGGSATAQQRFEGDPAVTLLEQPEMVDMITATLQLERTDENDEDAEEQWRTLNALKMQGPQAMIAEWGDEVAGTTFYGRVVEAERAATVATADEPGTIMATVVIRALDFS